MVRPPYALSPEAALHLTQAQHALRCSRPAQARQGLLQLPPAERKHPQVQRVLGMAAQACGDNVMAADCFRQALPAWPNDPALHMRLGIALFSTGRASEASTTLRRACQLAPDSAMAWFNLGEVLKTDARHMTEALDSFTRAIRLDPGHARARLSLGRVKASLGDVTGAVREFRAVLQCDPDDAQAWFSLSDLNVVHFSAAETQQLQQACRRSQPDSDAGNLLGFALGKALEQQGQYAEAFAAFQAANASWRRHTTWDSAAEHVYIQSIQKAFQQQSTPPAIDPQLGHGVIFIASLPRSGSSLVEHILASHPRVEGANEITDMPDVLRAETLRRGQALPAWAPTASASDWHRLGTEYLVRTARWRQHKPCFTDKNLLNWQWIGAIVAMLPGARVVIVSRDPVETCLACFRQRFASGMAFSYNLDELAQRCIDFHQLTRFWLYHYPDHVFDLAYEQLVAHPEATLRSLLDFCALPFDSACLVAHGSERVVLSAPSAAQVREPIRRTAPRAPCYEAHISQLRQRLHAAGL